MDQWILFLGRFHPLLVHLPIGILIAVAILECLRKVRKETSARTDIILLGLAFGGGVFSVISGLMLEREGGYSEGRVLAHMILGITMTVVIGIALLLKLLEAKGDKGTLAYRTCLAAGIALMFAASHQGGVLTHGRHFLTEHAPFITDKENRAKVEQPPKPAPDDGTVSYKLQIKPLMEAHCNECHNADKMKADLRLDSYEAIMKGSKWGAVVIPGNPEDSSFYFLTTFPADDPDRMPKDGDPLSAEEIRIIKDWIAQGAASDE